MATLTRNTMSSVAGSRNLNLGAAEANMTAVSASDVVTNLDGKTMLLISNQGGSTDNVSVTAQNTSQYSASGASITAAAETAAIATTERRILGPFPPSIYNDSSGNITITHSFTTSVKIYAFVLPF